MTRAEEPLHSALYFGDTRDFWWHDAFIASFLRRNGVDAATSVLDVGSGVGHWGRLLARATGAAFDVVGIDREPTWVEQATAAAAKFGSQMPNARFRYEIGDVTQKLAFADASFDLATCQTVLIHVPDPHALVREMARVTKRGGHVVVAEPTNAATNLARLVDGPETDIDATLRETRFHMMCERGKARLGLGFNSIGERVPGFFDRDLFETPDVAVNDRPDLIVPPYAGPAAEASVRELLEQADAGLWLFPKDEARRYYEAAAGRDFEAEYAFGLARERARVAQIRSGTRVTAGGALHYIVSARRK